MLRFFESFSFLPKVASCMLCSGIKCTCTCGTSNPITDFNAFFKQVAHISRKRNLSLTPITIILLTDGVNNSGSIEPVDAAQLAKLNKMHL